MAANDHCSASGCIALEVKLGAKKDAPRWGIIACQSTSCKQQLMRQCTHLHTITKLSDEEFSAIVEANEPLKVLLEYTFASNATLVKDSIQTRFGGVRLPTTIINADVVISNISNVVAMQVHFALVSFGIVAHLSVSTFPVAVVSDGVEHLAFDLTHDLKRFVELKVVWIGLGAIATPCVTLDQLVGNCLHHIAILSHNVTELVTDVSIGVGLVMHGKADIHGTIEIGHGLSLAESRAGHGVGHESFRLVCNHYKHGVRPFRGNGGHLPNCHAWVV